jgi:hypothetical protein
MAQRSRTYVNFYLGMLHSGRYTEQESYINSHEAGETAIQE